MYQRRRNNHLDRAMGIPLVSHHLWQATPRTFWPGEPFMDPPLIAGHYLGATMHSHGSSFSATRNVLTSGQTGRSSWLKKPCPFVIYFPAVYQCEIYCRHGWFAHLPSWKNPCHRSQWKKQRCLQSWFSRRVDTTNHESEKSPKILLSEIYTPKRKSAITGPR